MPKAFNDCRRAGGKIRTKKLSGKKYQHVCIKNGKVAKGHVKTRKSKR